MVLELPGGFATLTFKSVYPLMVLERTTAACIRTQQLLVSPVGRGAAAFCNYTRAVTTDAYAANMLAERLIGAERAPHQSGSVLHQVCDIHAFVGACNKTFNLLDEHITGVIRAALSLRCGSSMARFRKCLREEIESRFEICDGVPPLGGAQDIAGALPPTQLRVAIAEGAILPVRYPGRC